MYEYVGSKGLAVESVGKTARTRIDNVDDVVYWMRISGVVGAGERVATFIVDVAGRLWIADRHSEHVACADGQPVLSAGEMTFAIDRRGVEVVGVSNQSLGYCPSIGSWPAVAAALDAINIRHPGQFTAAYVIVRCRACDTRNIVKDDVYECAVCGSALT